MLVCSAFNEEVTTVQLATLLTELRAVSQQQLPVFFLNFILLVFVFFLQLRHHLLEEFQLRSHFL